MPEAVIATAIGRIVNDDADDDDDHCKYTVVAGSLKLVGMLKACEIHQLQYWKKQQQSKKKKKKLEKE